MKVEVEGPVWAKCLFAVQHWLIFTVIKMLKQGFDDWLITSVHFFFCLLPLISVWFQDTSSIANNISAQSQMIVIARPSPKVGIEKNLDKKQTKKLTTNLLLHT